jgi:hypothetical protein
MRKNNATLFERLDMLLFSQKIQGTAVALPDKAI